MGERVEANPEIAPNIHDIAIGLDATLGNMAPKVYLVAGREGAIIDSAYGDEEGTNRLIDYVNNTVGVPISYIVITHAHPDHISGSVRLRHKTGAKLVLHAAEVTDLPVDKRVAEGDIIPLGGIDLEVVHTPGHNPGHICPYIRERKIMFSGDHVLADSTTAIHPPWGDMAQYILSLRKLLDYDIDMLLPSHGPPITEPHRRLEELIQHRLEREGQVVALTRQGKGTVSELAREIYPNLNGFLYAIARGQLHAHLLKLEQEGKATSQGIGEGARFTLIQD